MHLLMFDIDGTLTDTNRVDEACYAQAIHEVLRIMEVDTNWHHYVHVTDSGIAADIAGQTLFREITSDELRAAEQAMVKHLWQAPDGDFAPVAGAAEFLDRVRADGRFAVAIATGGWNGSARLKLRRAGLDADGIPMATASDYDNRVCIMELAHERALKHANRTGFEGITYFGDGQWDLSASQCLGWQFVAIGEHHAKLKQAGAKHAFADWTDGDAVLAAVGG